jgi:hypothetical protein
MIFGYGASSAALYKKRLLVAMGMVAIPLSYQTFAKAASTETEQVKATVLPTDPRVVKLHGFFKKLDCPVAGMAQDFVRVADENKLDWRLLPSIAVIESGGGKVYRNNNIFGWNGGHQSFVTIRSGLELVAYKLGRSPLYRQYDSLGKLHIYNENQEYADSVLALMNRISPVTKLRTTEAQPQVTRRFGSLVSVPN